MNHHLTNKNKNQLKKTQVFTMADFYFAVYCVLMGLFVSLSVRTAFHILTSLAFICVYLALALSVYIWYHGKEEVMVLLDYLTMDGITLLQRAASQHAPHVWQFLYSKFV